MTRRSSGRTGADSEKAGRKHCYSRESGNPENFVLEVDSRFRENDGLKARVAYLHWQ